MGIFGGKQTTTRENTIDPYISRQSEYAANRALDINSRPYEAYGGQRVANLTGLEQRGSALARSNTGNYSPYYQRSRRLSQSASADFNPAALGKYQTQYQTNVTDPALKRLRDKGSQNIGRITANEKKTSAFGDMFDRKGAALSQLNEGLADTQAMGDYEGYNYAVENYGRDRQNEAELANRYQQMGDTVGALGSIDVNRLMAAGGRERGINQAQDNFDYGQYLEGRDWDQNRLNELVRTLQGAEYDRTSTTRGPGGNNVAAGLGALATVAGSYMQGQSSQPSWDYTSTDSPDPSYYQPGGGYDQSTDQGFSEIPTFGGPSG